MAVFLRPGQSVRRPAVLALVSWTSTSGGKVAVTVEAEEGSSGATVVTPAPGKLVVPRLEGPVRLVANPEGTATFETGTTVQLQVVLRAPDGSQEEVLPESTDLSASSSRTLLRLAPAEGQTWQVALDSESYEVSLSDEARRAYYAARRAVPAPDPGGGTTLLAVDGSASMAAAVHSGLLQDVFDVFAGVASHCVDPSQDVPVLVYGARPRLTEQALRPSSSAGYVARHLSSRAPTSGAVLAPVVSRALSLGHARVVVVSDSAPADLDDLTRLLAGGSPGVAVTYLLLGQSQWAAHRDDVVTTDMAWRDEARALHPLIDEGAVRVISVPFADRLDPARADALACGLAKAVAA